jgi:hypothetical protein
LNARPSVTKVIQTDLSEEPARRQLEETCGCGDRCCTECALHEFILPRKHGFPGACCDCCLLVIFVGAQTVHDPLALFHALGQWSYDLVQSHAQRQSRLSVWLK